MRTLEVIFGEIETINAEAEENIKMLKNQIKEIQTRAALKAGSLSGEMRSIMATEPKIASFGLVKILDNLTGDNCWCESEWSPEDKGAFTSKVLITLGISPEFGKEIFSKNWAMCEDRNGLYYPECLTARKLSWLISKHLAK